MLNESAFRKDKPVIKVDRSRYTYSQNFDRNKGEYIGTTTYQKVVGRGLKGNGSSGISVRQNSSSHELKMCIEPHAFYKNKKNVSSVLNTTNVNDTSQGFPLKELKNISNVSMNLKEKKLNDYSMIYDRKNRASHASNVPIKPPHVKM